jgi:hypothetical protein
LAEERSKMRPRREASEMGSELGSGVAAGTRKTFPTRL